MTATIAPLTINLLCVAFLTLMAVLIPLATRMKPGPGYAAVFIFLSNTPFYLYNTVRYNGCVRLGGCVA